MHRGRGHETALKLALGENLKLALGRDRGSLALLAEEKNPFAIRHRRCRVVPAHTLAPDDFAGLGLDTCRAAAVIDHENVFADQQYRRFVGDAAFGAPFNVGLSRIITAARVDRKQLTFRKTGWIKHHAVSIHGTGARRVLRSLCDAPKFTAAHRVVRVASHRADTDQLRDSVVPDDVRRGVALAQITIAERLAVRVEILKINAALGAPDGFAGVLVQRGNELVIGPVEREDEQVFVYDRRRTGPTKMVAHKIVPRPQHLVDFGVETGRARRTPRQVHPILFDNRRR